MAQQLSPWLETAYGWGYGENGWNVGMDSNLLKFSVMFDRNVDGIVTSLPPAENGKVYYNTVDNRLYFAANGSYSSTVVPKWFTVVVRNSGLTWQFNGTSLVQLESVNNLDTRLDSLELTVVSLGSAAFEDRDAFAKQADLDVVSAHAATYTDTLRADLGSTSTPLKGAGQLGFNAQLNYPTNTVGDAVRRISLNTVTFAAYGAINDGVTDSTAQCQAAIAAAIAAGGTLDISGNYAVTSLSLAGANGLRVTGRGSIVGIAAVATPSVLDIRNVANVAIDGAWFINGAYNTNYSGGVWVYTDAPGQAAAFLEFTNLSPVNCKKGWMFGNAARPDDLVSEINIRGGMTSGCPVAVEAVGLQTVVNFSGTTLISSYGSGDAGWQALTQKTVVAIGSTVHISGGELVHPAISAGTLCEIQPITGGTGTLYGNIHVTGTVCEPACPIATTSNPSTLVSPQKGSIQFTNCNGVHTQNDFAFVQTDTTFVGRLGFKGNYFHATTARTQANIHCGALCEVFTDEQSWGPGFVSPIGGVVGGIVRFNYRMVANVSNLAGQTINNNTPTLLNFTSEVSSGDMVRFNPYYSAGVFTVPAGGLKNVRIESQILKAGLSGEWYVRINDTAYGIRTLGTYNNNSYSIDSLSAGDTIKIVTLNTGGVLAAASATTDWLQIFASA